MKLRHTTVTSKFFYSSAPPWQLSCNARQKKRGRRRGLIVSGLAGKSLPRMVCWRTFKKHWLGDERTQERRKKECVYCLNITCVLNKENLHFGQYRDFFLFFLLSFYTTCLTILTEFFHLHIHVYMHEKCQMVGEFVLLKIFWTLACKI